MNRDNLIRLAAGIIFFAACVWIALQNLGGHGERCRTLPESERAQCETTR